MDTRDSTRRGAWVVALAAVLAVGVVAGVAVANDDFVRGSPDVTVLAPENELVPGEETTIELQLNNRGDILSEGSDSLENEVMTARTTKLSIDDSSAPVTAKTDEQAIGAVGEGASGPYEFTVVPDEDAEPGEYELDVELDYVHAWTARLENGSTETDDRHVTETTSVTVEISDRSRFAVVDTTTKTQVGQSGTVAVELMNVGEDTARNASVEAQLPDQAVTFSSGSEVSQTFVDDWEPGENRTVEYAIDVGDDVEPRPYLLDLEIEFWDDLKVDQQSRTVPAGVTPASGQEFATTTLASDLSVGASGSVEAEVENLGPADVENVVVFMEPETDGLEGELAVGEGADDLTLPEDPNVVPTEPMFTVGDLAVGETEPVSFTLDVRDDAEPGDRTFTVATRYRNTDGDVYVSDPLDVIAEVDPEREEFTLEPVDERFAPGDSGSFEVNVTNTGGDPVSNVEAKLFTDSPLDSDDDETFVEHLDPNETTTLTFDLSVDGDAQEKAYAASIDFRYDDADGTSTLSDSYRVPVVAEEDDGFSVVSLLGILAAFAALGAGAIVWQRDRLEGAAAGTRLEGPVDATTGLADRAVDRVGALTTGWRDDNGTPGADSEADRVAEAGRDPGPQDVATERTLRPEPPADPADGPAGEDPTAGVDGPAGEPTEPTAESTATDAESTAGDNPPDDGVDRSGRARPDGGRTDDRRRRDPSVDPWEELFGDGRRTRRDDARSRRDE